MRYRSTGPPAQRSREPSPESRGSFVPPLVASDLPARRRRRTIPWRHLTTALLFAASSGARSQEYHITDLGTLGGTWSVAYDVNDRGLVVGQAQTNTIPPAVQAFRWQNGTIFGRYVAGQVNGQAQGTNNRGRYVGFAHLVSASADRGFIDDTTIGTLTGGGSSGLYDINEAGDAAGFSTVGTKIHAMKRRSDGTLVDLGVLGIPGYGSAFAYAINDSGWIVGESNPPTDVTIWLAIIHLGQSMQMLPTWTGHNSTAFSINRHGDVVGLRQMQASPRTKQAVFWPRVGPAQVLTTAYSTAWAVNNNRQIVGTYFGPDERAFVYDSVRGMRDLNALIPPNSGWTLQVATGINNRGQIVGHGLHAGLTRAFLLTPGKRLIVRDAQQRPLKLAPIRLTVVRDNPPSFSDSLIGSFVTDSAGVVAFPFDGLPTGSRIRVECEVRRFPAAKHTSQLPVMYTLALDNVRFDSLTSAVRHDTLDEAEDQVIVLGRTTVAYNLLVSVEWDADLQYLAGLQESIRRMANYLYDVGDGQVRIDTVLVFDNAQHWADADVQIFASNMVWPHVQDVAGILRGGDPVEMPRKWFGSSDGARNGSFSEDPLDLTVSDEFRTKAHEFGHYGPGFYDEYQYVSGDRCAPPPLNFGFMQTQYDDQRRYPMNSEMSDAGEYVNTACRNTRQFALSGTSCWQHFEQSFEGRYPLGADSVYVPIVRSDERWGGLLAGPNDSMAIRLDHDVGSLVRFPRPPTPTSARSVVVTVLSVLGNRPVANVNVWHRIASTGRWVDQGNTSDTGKIRALGVVLGDRFRSGLRRVRVDTSGAPRTAPPRTEAVWEFGEALLGASGLSGVGNAYRTSPGGDSLAVVLRRVQGDLPAVVGVAFSGGTLEYRLHMRRRFPALPSLEVTSAPGDTARVPFAVRGYGYAAAVTGGVGGGGGMTIWAADDSSSTFFAPTGYVAIQTGSGSSRLRGTGFRGGSDFSLDSLPPQVYRAVVVSSDYPPDRTGLDSAAVQVGATHSLALLPAATPGGSSRVLIRYAESDLGGLAYFLERSIRVFRWNESAARWVLMGGTVDTAFNEVSVRLTEAGTYAAFTTAGPTGLQEEEDGKPFGFGLEQNFPNPFNPSTTVVYEIPSPLHVMIKVYDVLGREVRTLVDALLQPGRHRVEFEANSMASGVYFYRLQAGGYSQSRKLVIVR